MFLMDIQNKNSEDKLKRLLSESRLEMPFDDFEDRLMARINKKVSNEKYIDRNIRFSWLFFALGTVFGLLLSVILSPVKSAMGIPFSGLMIPLYIIGVTLIFLFIDQLITFTLNRKKQHE